MMPIPPSMMPDVPSILGCEKATILFKDNLRHAYTVVQVKDFVLRAAPYAQHDQGLYFKATKKGAHRPFAIGMGKPGTLIVVDGWPDLTVPDAYHPAQDTGNGVTVQHGRAMSCDPVWEHEARAAAHATGKVLFDAHEMG